MTKNAAYYDVIYHNETTNNESHAQYAANTLADALEAAWFERKYDEYVYITDPETGETFLTDDGVTLAIVPEV